MPSEPKRKLAAIMFTDMVGYTALMQEDESKARELIQRHRDLMKPLIEKHSGTILQYVGDGTFCTFDSAIEAVNCGYEIQNELKSDKDLSLRIGIHIGDVVVDGDEVYGDGVNVASRLEPLAEPGGICLSGEVYTQIKNQPGIDIVAGGSKELKNVKDPVDIYFVGTSSEKVRSASGESVTSEKSILRKYIYSGATVIALLLVLLWNLPFFSSGERALEASGEIRSIAVLPLENLSNDPDQEYFSDGMTEALIANIGKIRALKVISRTSVMRYKGTDKSLPDIAKELQVDAILEGSVMHAEGEVRISTQLIRASTDEQLWAESYTDKLENIMMLQSRIAKAIAKEIKLTLTPEEELKLSSNKKINPEAHEAFLRGKYYWNLRTSEDIQTGLTFFQDAVKSEPLYALAHVKIAESYILLHVYSEIPTKETYPKAKASALKALEIDPNLGEAHISIAAVLSDYYWDWEESEIEFKKGLELSPNYATGHHWYAAYLTYMGRFDEGLKEIKIARELDPLSMIILGEESTFYYWSGDVDSARIMMDRNIELYPDFSLMYSNRAYLHFNQGENEDAALMWLKVAELQNRPAVELQAMKRAVESAGFKEMIKVKHEFDMKHIPVYSHIMAYNYYVMGDYEKSLDWLERALDERTFRVTNLKVNPDFSDPVFRSNPRFQALLEKMNFPN